LIIPLKSDVSEDEYPAVARMVAKEIGIDNFDDTTYEPSRLMYWPSTPSNGEFFFEQKDGDILEPDFYLSQYDDWRDTTTWTVSSRQYEVVQRNIKKQAEPLEKDGIISAYCRAYSIEKAIDSFLSHEYEPSLMEGRFDYKPADSSAGVVVYNGKFAYSHHATDPASGNLLNAFDLVRLHLFQDIDDKTFYSTTVTYLPSFNAMTDLNLKY